MGISGVIHEESRMAVLPAFDTITVPATQCSVDKSIVTKSRPISILANSNYIEMEVPPGMVEYIRLDETVLWLKLRVSSGKDKPLKKDWTSFTPAQYTMHSFIKHAELTIGDVIVTQSNSTYAYRAYFEALLGFNQTAKDTHLKLALWDTEANRKNAFLPALPATAVTEESEVPSTLHKDIIMMGRLHFDLTWQERAIIPGVPIRLKLIPHDPSFTFKYNAGFLPKIEILDAELRVHRAKATAGQLKAHRLDGPDPARYPVSRLELKTASLINGKIDYMLDNLVIGNDAKTYLHCNGY